MSAASVESSRPAMFRLELVCDLAEVRPATLAVRNFLAEQGWDAQALMGCELALVEACNNAVNYSDDRGRRQSLRVEAVCDATQVELRVIDHTPGFEWPEQVKLPEPESERGRGLFLISSLMDHPGYFRGRGENILVMRKARSAALAPVSLAELTNQQTCEGRLAENEQVLVAMVEELSSCYESLSAIFRYRSEQGKPGNLEDFARRLLKDLLQIISANWFVLRLVPKGESRMLVFAASEPSLELEPLTIPVAVQTGAPPEIEAAVTRQDVWFDYEHPLPPGNPLRRIKPDSVGLVHPFFFGDNLIGTLTVGKVADRGASLTERTHVVFTAAQTNVVNTFVDLLAVRIVDRRLQEEEVSSRLVTHELEIATNIQRSLLRQSLPQPPGFGLAGFCRSAREVGGDFYDVLKLTDQSSLLVIADVMGKGIPAALFAAILRTLLRSAPELTHRPSALLTRVNQVLFEELSSVDMFITAQLAFLDARDRRLTVASAGHCPLLLAMGDGSGVKTFSPDGMPLGIVFDPTFRDETVELPKPCRALLYTDGLTEALNARGERYGQERLMNWLGTCAVGERRAEQLRVSLARELEKFQSNATLNDDQTFLILAE